jgi:hypothetical protein
VCRSKLFFKLTFPLLGLNLKSADLFDIVNAGLAASHAVVMRVGLHLLDGLAALLVLLS